MSPFQIVALIFLAVVLIATVAAAIRGAISRREGFAWALTWLVAGIAIARPEFTTVVARKLGIGRGANLVLYCAVVLMLVGFLMVYARLRRLRHEMTLIVRHLAIRDAMSKPQHGEAETDAPAHED
ncbi:MAG: DUF2304 domain-containing protein [Phycisphaerales bacterium]|nr:MAG: DUF2304 domain-containing protein [Phycisphaerales bacterium]